MFIASPYRRSKNGGVGRGGVGEVVWGEVVEVEVM